MNSEHTNAVAGPSTLSMTPPPPSTMPHSSSSSTPYSSDSPLFLPPPAPPPPKQHLASTQDLLSRFHLLPAYNKYVRPSLLPGADPSNDGAPPSTPGAAAVQGTSGKGKEVLHRNAVTMGNTPADMELGDGGDGDDDDVTGGKGEKKKKNTYRHLIKGIPGKHSLKKDDSLTKAILEPPKQRTRIAHFDLRTLEEAFTVSLEGLKGWNINTLVLESAQAREDRKKRKELKRLAKLQAQQGGPLSQASTPSQQQHQQAHPPPIPSGPAASAASHPQPIHTPISSDQVQQRGKKREREDGNVVGMNGVVNGVAPQTGVLSTGLAAAPPAPPPPQTLTTNGYVNGNGIGPLKAIANARAGTAGVRPRPIKKQKTDVQGQTRDVTTPVQQPTPQGI